LRLAYGTAVFWFWFNKVPADFEDLQGGIFLIAAQRGLACCKYHHSNNYE
jgi:hypothetical protein